MKAGGINHPFSLDKVTYRYWRAKSNVIDGINLDLSAGPVLLLGRNGAGKSTLLKLMAGLLKPRSGKVHAEGVVVYLPQNFVPVAGFTALDYVVYLGWINGRPRSEAAADALEWLEKVGLANFTEALCTDLSGGQQARLALAMAMNSGADLVLLDEPGASLDPLSKNALRGLYRLVADAGSALVVSSHDPMDINGPFQRVVIIDGGEIIFDDSPVAFKNDRHDNSLVAAFSRSMAPANEDRQQ